MRLVVAVHGTRSPEGQAEYRALRSLVAGLLPTVDVRLGHLDVQRPAVADLATAGDVVVPALLARGFHVRVDCAGLVSGGVLVADAVGPDPALLHLLDQRLAGAGAGLGWPVVLVAAGSRDPLAVADLRAAAGALAARRRTRVELAMASRPGSAQQAVEALRRETGGPVAAASWFVAPGAFASAAAQCGADVVGRPLGACTALAGVIVSRYHAARQLQEAQSGERPSGQAGARTVATGGEGRPVRGAAPEPRPAAALGDPRRGRGGAADAHEGRPFTSSAASCSTR